MFFSVPLTEPMVELLPFALIKYQVKEWKGLAKAKQSKLTMAPLTTSMSSGGLMITGPPCKKERKEVHISKGKVGKCIQTFYIIYSG